MLTKQKGSDDVKVVWVRDDFTGRINTNNDNSTKKTVGSDYKVSRMTSQDGDGESGGT